MIGEGLYAHIETDFLRSSKVLSLPLGARWLYLAIWCYSLEQRREIIERPPDDYLATIAGLRRHPITTYLQRLHDCKLLIVNDGHIAVIGLRKKHRKINFKPEFENSGIEFEFFQDCSFLSYPSLSVPFRSPPSRSVPSPSDEGDNNIPKKPKKQKPQKQDLPEPGKFEQFWSVYPRKINKGGARKAWKARIAEGVASSDIIRAASFYADAVQGRDPAHILHPSTFMSQEQRRWEDYLNGDPDKDLRSQSKNMDLTVFNNFIQEDGRGAVIDVEVIENES